MICFIDFETTGIDVFRDDPIQIGAVLVNSKLEIVKEFSSLIKVKKSTYLTKRAYNIHNIHRNDLIDAPDQKKVLESFFSELGTEYRLAGWNISFDVTFLRKLSHKNGMMVQYNKINHRHVDVQSMGYLSNVLGISNKKNYSLNDWKDYFGFSRSQSHSAIEDARLTLLVYKELIKIFEDKLNG